MKKNCAPHPPEHAEELFIRVNTPEGKKLVPLDHMAKRREQD